MTREVKIQCDIMMLRMNIEVETVKNLDVGEEDGDKDEVGKRNTHTHTPAISSQR